MLLQDTPVAAASPHSAQLLFYSVRNFRHKKLVEGLVARARPIVRRHNQRRDVVRSGPSWMERSFQGDPQPRRSGICFQGCSA